MRADGQVCFRLPTGESAPSFGPGLLLRLRDVHQEALADLLQILACGEESTWAHEARKLLLACRTVLAPIRSDLPAGRTLVQ